MAPKQPRKKATNLLMDVPKDKAQKNHPLEWATIDELIAEVYRRSVFGLTVLYTKNKQGRIDVTVRGSGSITENLAAVAAARNTLEANHLMHLRDIHIDPQGNITMSKRKESNDDNDTPEAAAH